LTPGDVSSLVLPDLYVKDRQKYASCVKISSEDVLNMLIQNRKTIATHYDLTILRFVALACSGEFKKLVKGWQTRSKVNFQSVFAAVKPLFIVSVEKKKKKNSRRDGGRRIAGSATACIC
jgi:hypothetical protein